MNLTLICKCTDCTRQGQRTILSELLTVSGKKITKALYYDQHNKFYFASELAQDLLQLVCDKIWEWPGDEATSASLWQSKSSYHTQCMIHNSSFLFHSEQSNHTPRCSQRVSAAGLPWLEHFGVLGKIFVSGLQGKY